MTKNTGKPSQNAFESIMRRTWGKRVFIHRITDSAEVRGMAGAGWTKAQPSDYIVTENGYMYYAEVKSSNNKTSFPFDNFEKGQNAAMIQQEAANGEYWCYLHNLNTGIWYKVPGRVIQSHPRSSIKWTEIETYRWTLQ